MPVCLEKVSFKELRSAVSISFSATILTTPSPHSLSFVWIPRAQPAAWLWIFTSTSISYWMWPPPPVYQGVLNHFIFSGQFPFEGLPWYPASLELCYFIGLSFALHLVPTYEWTHTMYNIPIIMEHCENSAKKNVLSIECLQKEKSHTNEQVILQLLTCQDKRHSVTVVSLDIWLEIKHLCIVAEWLNLWPLG